MADSAAGAGPPRTELITQCPSAGAVEVSRRSVGRCAGGCMRAGGEAAGWWSPVAGGVTTAVAPPKRAARRMFGPQCRTLAVAVLTVTAAAAAQGPRFRRCYSSLCRRLHDRDLSELNQG